jgi:hypothetical protein
MNEIKINDSVYWRRQFKFGRYCTYCGIVKSIDDKGIAKIRLTMQNQYGFIYIDTNKLTKKK